MLKLGHRLIKFFLHHEVMKVYATKYLYNNNKCDIGCPNDAVLSYFIFSERWLLWRALTILWCNSERNKELIQALFYLATKLKHRNSSLKDFM